MTAALNRAMKRITQGDARRQTFVTATLCVVTLLAAQWARAADKVTELVNKVSGHVAEQFQFFSFMTSDQIGRAHV